MNCILMHHSNLNQPTVTVKKKFILSKQKVFATELGFLCFACGGITV